jgi:molybdopterin-binding protein
VDSLPLVAEYGIGEAASVLGVSTDTVRRWIDSGHLAATRTAGGRRRIDAAVLARFAQSLYGRPDTDVSSHQSARNHLPGIVTKVVKDKVMAQVEVQAGPFRVVALISREAVDDMGLAPGSMVHAIVKATNVSLELSVP